MSTPEIDNRLNKYLEQNEPTFNRITKYNLIAETANTLTYLVTFKEVVCGVSGIDHTEVTISKNAGYVPTSWADN